MNQKIKKILLSIAIFCISLALFFMVLAIFASLSMTKAGSVFALSLSVLLGILLAKCIKALKNQSFKNKKIIRNVTAFFVILGIASTFFLPKSNKNSNSIGDTSLQSENIVIDDQRNQKETVEVIDNNETLFTDTPQEIITSENKFSGNNEENFAENLLETDLIAENKII